MIKNTRFGTLRSLAIAGIIGGCSLGVSQGAVTVLFEEIDGGGLTATITGTFDTPDGSIWTTGSYSNQVTSGPTLSGNLLSSETTGGTGASWAVIPTYLGSFGDFFSAGGWSGGQAGGSYIGTTNSIGIAASSDVIALSGGSIILSHSTHTFASLGLTTGDELTGSYAAVGGGTGSVTYTTNAVPEPNIALLSVTGLLLLSARRKRK